MKLKTFHHRGDAYVVFEESLEAKGFRAAREADEKTTSRDFFGNIFGDLSDSGFDSRDDELSLTAEAVRDAHRAGLRLAIHTETGSAVIESGVLVDDDDLEVEL